VVYGIEDADLEDGEDADLEDGYGRRAALLAKQRREAPPTTLALLHRQMVCGRMERHHAKRVAHQERVDRTKTAHDIDAGPALATTTTITARLPRSFKLSGIQV
jgi:hypothetical protein